MAGDGSSGIRSIVILAASIVISSVAVAGCSALTVPDPKDIAKKPLGTETIRVGMVKAQIESLWGRPDDIRMVEDPDRWPGPREVWTYRGRCGNIPVDAGYLSKTKRLYFDGPNLTEIGE
jgi:hypothetical protein